MTIRHIDTGEYIQAQQEKIERLQAELQWHRTNLTNGYGQVANKETTMDINLEDFDTTYYITDNRLWLSLNGQAHLPVDINELVAGYEKRIAELEVTLEQMEGLYAGSTQVAIESGQRIAELEWRNKQQELSILSLGEAYREQKRWIAELKAEIIATETAATHIADENNNLGRTVESQVARIAELEAALASVKKDRDGLEHELLLVDSERTFTCSSSE